MKRILFALALIMTASTARAADVYLAQLSSGSGAGTNCANARTVSGTTWTAGNTYHLCGTLTSAVTPNASGTSSLKITILFETGAKISMAAIPTDSGSGGGAINLANRSWVVVDGGTNGIIESTANGTGLANHINSVGVGVDSASNIEIKNVTFQNLFKNKCCTDGSQFGQGTYAQGSLTNIHFHDNTCTQLFACVQWQTTGTSSNLEADHNSLPNQDVGWGIVIVMGDVGFKVTGVFIHDNDITPGSGTGATSNSFAFSGSNSWCTGTSNLTHLDPIHTWSQGSSPAGMFDDEIYNNHVHGYFCVNQSTANSTTGIFWEAHVSGGNAVNDAIVYNNLVEMIGGHPGDGAIYKQDGTNGFIYNNTVICNGADSGQIGTELASGNATYTNNIIQGCVNRGLFNSGATVTGTKNIFYNNGTNNTTGLTGTITANPNLDANYVPTVGSNAVGAGSNLVSLAITPLNTSKPLIVGVGATTPGVARPGVGGWDIGAYELSGTPAPVAVLAPSSLTFANQVISTSSASQNLTLSNTGSANLTISSISITGTNSGDFSQSNTCPGTVSSGGSCTISVTFTPSATGARVAIVSVADNAVGSPHTSSLSGTGINSLPVPTPHRPVIFGSLPNGTVGTPYSGALSISSDQPPNVWTENPTIPGLSFNGATGALTGTPTQAGTFNPTFTITDSFPCQSGDSTCFNTSLPYTTSLTIASSQPPPTGNYLITSRPASLSFVNSGCSSLLIDDTTPDAPLPIAVSDDKPWITVMPSSGQTKLSVSVCANGSGLAAGTYAGHVIITQTALNSAGEGVSNSPLSIPVTLVIQTRRRRR